jgi:hypothetical protein
MVDVRALRDLANQGSHIKLQVAYNNNRMEVIVVDEDPPEASVVVAILWTLLETPTPTIRISVILGCGDSLPPVLIPDRELRQSTRLQSFLRHTPGRLVDRLHRRALGWSPLRQVRRTTDNGMVRPRWCVAGEVNIRSTEVVLVDDMEAP